MRGPLPGVLLVLTLVSSAHGWGYIFSKFRPEASSNWGSYGGAGLSGPPERLSPREQLMEALLGEEFLEDEVCRGRRCTSNEHCCPGHLCVGVDSTTGGSCMAVGNRLQSPDCASDLDCADGHVCEMGSCAAASPAERKGYSEVCVVSAECDFGRGLCCQFIRRHRQAPRKMCSYFKDPLSCIGHMETEAKRSRAAQ